MMKFKKMTASLLGILLSAQGAFLPAFVEAEEAYSVSWTVGKEYTFAGQQMVAVDVTVQGDTALNSYSVKISPDSRLTFVTAKQGNAYSNMDFSYDVAKNEPIILSGKSVENTVTTSNAPVFTLYFDVPVDAFAGEKFEIALDGIEIGREEENATVNVVTQNGWIEVLETASDPSGTYEYEYYYQDGAYYQQAYLVDSDDNWTPYGEPIEIPRSSIPEDAYISNEPLLGDIDNDGEINAKDASIVLLEACYLGSENESYISNPANWEIWGQALSIESADVDRNGNVNADDALYILNYAACKGVGLNPDIKNYANLQKENGETAVITIMSNTLSLEQLRENDYTVPVYIYWTVVPIEVASADYIAGEIGLTIDKECSYSLTKQAPFPMQTNSENESWVAYVGRPPEADGIFTVLNVKIPENVTADKVYSINSLLESNSQKAFLTSMKNDTVYSHELIVQDGFIKIEHADSEVSGDINHDGSLSVVDIVQAYQTLHSGKALPKICDMNHDDKVNIIDIALMKKALLNQ